MNTALSVEIENLADGNQVITSISIERVLKCRSSALEKIGQALDLLAEAGKLTSAAGGGNLQDWGTSEYSRYNTPLTSPKDEALEQVTKRIDRDIWATLMNKSGMLDLMDAQAKGKWYDDLREFNVPEVTKENVYATFAGLHSSKEEVFERGVINVFRGLSWDYATNCPCKFGNRIIMNCLVQFDEWGFTLSNRWRRDELVDLERMLHLMDGKAIPVPGQRIDHQLEKHIAENRHVSRVYEDNYFSIRYFKKGSAHVTFKRPDLISRLNEILAKQFPGALPARV